MRTLLVFLPLFMFSFGALATPEWKLKKDENGIRIFTSHEDSSAVKSIRVEFTVQATKHQLIAFLLDVDKQPSWIYNSKSAYVISAIQPNDLIFYSVITLPWPCSNRDYVAHFRVTQESKEHIVIESHAEQGHVPPRKGMVRVTQSAAHWDITSVSENEQRIVYTVQFDPGGGLPSWLVNTFATKGPYHTFQKLREGVKQPQYANAHVAFLR